jgi:hypothetical protein
MTPIEKVLSRLPGHRTAGDGFKACCPSHEDRNPSLSIREADDGTVLVKCFGGCTTPQVVSDLGLNMAELFPTTCEPPWPANTIPKPHSQPRNFASADDAIKALKAVNARFVSASAGFFVVVSVQQPEPFYVVRTVLRL